MNVWPKPGSSAELTPGSLCCLRRASVAAQTLSQELAREMHDVVSHQVSSIGAQTGALSQRYRHTHVRETATRVRALAVQTLEELRHMVGVLRAAGGDTAGIEPQPTTDDVGKLLESSGVEVSADIELPQRSPIAVQRTIYRTIQEGLTNVRKHAPGSTVSIPVGTTSTRLTVCVENSAPTGARVVLPSAHHGLIGLAERADLLGGHIHAEATEDGGHRLRMDLSLAPELPTTTPAPSTTT